MTEYRLQVKTYDIWETIYTTTKMRRVLEAMMERARTSPAGTEFRIRTNDEEQICKGQKCPEQKEDNS